MSSEREFNIYFYAKSLFIWDFVKMSWYVWPEFAEKKWEPTLLSEDIIEGFGCVWVWRQTFQLCGVAILHMQSAKA